LGIFDDSSELASLLKVEEEAVHTYRTSQTGMGTAMLNELVKSYGLKRRDDGVFEWSLDNIAQAFKEDPIWTSLDYATMMFSPAKFGLAAAGIARGASTAGAIGKGYQALRAGETVTELAGKTATTKLGRTFEAFGMNPELAAATEMKLASGSSVLHAWKLPGSERRVSLANPAATNFTQDHLNLVGRFDGEVWEKRAILRVQDREKLIEQAKVGRQAEEIAAQIGAAKLGRAGNERFMELLSTRIDDTQIDDVVAQEFGDDAAAAKAFRNTWGYRNTIHQQAYELGLISKETYEANLFKYNPRIYEEMVQAREDLKALGHTGDSLPGTYKGSPDGNERITTDIDPNRDAASRMVKGERSSFQKGSLPGEEPEYLTRILDPAVSLTRLAQAGQEIAKQRFAQGLSKSILAGGPEQILSKVGEALASGGDLKKMQMIGLTSDKLEKAGRLMKNLKTSGREVTGEQLYELLGWRKLDSLYHGKDMPDYLKKLPDEVKNKWLDPTVADEVEGGLRMLGKEKDLYSSIYKNVVSSFRAGKTAYNPGTHVRNFLGGGIFATIASGDIRSFVPVRGLKAFREGGDELKAAAEAGAIGSSFDLEIHSEIAKEANLAARTALDWMPNNAVTNIIKKGAGKAERFYRATDEVYKLDAWLRATEKYQKNGHTLEKARDLATIDINKFMPNFLQHSGVADTLRKGIPFASFTTESLRVWKNVLAEKPHMAYFYNHVASTMSDVFGAMGGYAPHEIEEAKNALPSYLQGKKTLLLPFNVDGKPRFLDLSYVIPMGSISEMEDTERLFFTPLLDPSTNPIMNIGAAAATGKDPFSGREIAPNFTERQLGIAVTGQQTRHVLGLAEHMLQTLMPPLAPPGYAGVNLLEAVRGQVNPSTGQPLEEGVMRTVLANVAGLRTYSPSVESQIKNVKEEQRKIADEVKQAWDRWEFSRANGDVSKMENERQRIIAIKTREGHDDPEGYFKGSEKKRSSAFSELSTKQLEAIMKRADKIGKLSERDERVRAELVARYQSRKD
jgi:hypothetical protein